MAAAHPLGPVEWRDVAAQWTWDPVMVAVLSVAAAAYGTGLGRVWNTAGLGHGLKRTQAMAYGAGIAVVAVALFSPVDALSDLSFAAHMTQHELLMAVGAPLIVLGRPAVAYAWALPGRHRSAALRAIATPVVRTAWRALTAPLVVLVLHALVRWVWHVPLLFEAAMREEALHAVQHASFFFTAVLFWWSLVQGRYGKAGYGVSLLFVFATALHTSVLGALIALAPALLYPIYRFRSFQLGIDALTDQELAGLLMWVPSGLTFVAASLALFVAWLGESERRARSQELALSRPPPDER